ncbi:MAG: CHAD domain-containing protein [Bacteroidales bacterium]|nr:CHAD domain-containing protein [Bacteroidales bacterium]
METDPLVLKEIKPALTGYLREALALLGRSPFPDDDAIHDIRVLMKRQRATVRLIRPLIDEVSYNREYIAGREVGRMLSSWRETSVLRKTVRELRKENPELFSKLKDNEKVREMLRKPYSSWEKAAEKSSYIKTIGTQLTRALYRVRFLTLDNTDLKLLSGGLERNYLIAARAYLDCRNNPKQSLIHEFRKKSKTFLYQLWFFRPLNLSAIKALEKKLDSLTQNLGKFNDLAQIREQTGYSYQPDNDPVMDELAIVIRDKQERYLSKVWPDAYRIFRPGNMLHDLPGFKSLPERLATE